MTKKSELPLWLCLGNKDGSGKCLFSAISIEKEEKPLFASSYATHKVNVLVIYCKKKKQYIKRYISSCGDYVNRTLDSF